MATAIKYGISGSYLRTIMLYHNNL
jgi:hypothetical protein